MFETVMNKSVSYIPSEEEIKDVNRSVNYVLYSWARISAQGERGMERMFSKDGFFWENKGWLIDAMSRHPLYNGKYQIVIKGADMSRSIDNDEAVTCFNEIVIERRRIWANCHKLAEEKLFWTHVERRISIFLERCGNPTVDEDFANKINSMAESFGVDFKIFKDQKISKVIAKYGKVTGVKEWTSIQDVSFYDASGTLHSRTKDMGWNHWFSRLADAVNPIELKGTAILSVHPVDFLLMSNGKDWRSCHAIGKFNGISNHHNGCYKSGTISYMLDRSSAVFYYLPEDYEGAYPELQPKLKRCMFFFGEDKIIQSRVYPDGRDGGDNSLPAQIRSIVQKITAEIFDVPNYWSIEGGIDVCRETIDTEGTHYPDYVEYEDSKVCYMKRIDGYKNTQKIRVGNTPICPICGEYHNEEGSLLCWRCEEDDY